MEVVFFFFFNSTYIPVGLIMCVSILAILNPVGVTVLTNREVLLPGLNPSLLFGSN